MAKITVEYLQELLFGEKRCSTMSKVVELINEKASEPECVFAICAICPDEDTCNQYGCYHESLPNKPV